MFVSKHQNNTDELICVLLSFEETAFQSKWLFFFVVVVVYFFLNRTHLLRNANRDFAKVTFFFFLLLFSEFFVLKGSQ